MTQIAAIYQQQGIQPNAVQQQMLQSHVGAMASRSLSGEPLPEVEAELFEDIPPETLALAQQVVDLAASAAEPHWAEYPAADRSQQSASSRCQPAVALSQVPLHTPGRRYYKRHLRKCNSWLTA